VRAWCVVRSPVTEPPAGTPNDKAVTLSQQLIDLGLRSGLASVGIASADVFTHTRGDLFERKARGLHAGMQFTYRNPERSTDPRRILPSAQSLVVGAWSYRHLDPRPIPIRMASSAPPSVVADAPVARLGRPMGQVARYARHDHYADLRRALTVIADRLKAEGARAAVVCDDNALVDRAAAHRAGLGWFGKNSMILLPGLGSWFVLGTVVTDVRLTTTSPEPATPHGGGCGSCSRCLSACPTGALSSPGVLDASRCLAWLVQAEGSFPEEHRRALGGRIYGCDECQEVCPINRIADRKNPPPADAAPTAAIDLLDILASTDEALLATHGRWYIPGRDPRYLRRNALVALGNVGDGDDPDTERALRHWTTVEDPLLVEHARWAARQLGRDDLARSEPRIGEPVPDLGTDEHEAGHPPARLGRPARPARPDVPRPGTRGRGA
jgi:epoxyqueuosine reductase